MDATLKIHRYVEGKSWVDTFTVPRSTGLTVLGALTYIKEQQDPTLSFTCSCRSSICGAMRRARQRQRRALLRGAD